MKGAGRGWTARGSRAHCSGVRPALRLLARRSWSLGLLGLLLAASCQRPALSKGLRSAAGREPLLAQASTAPFPGAPSPAQSPAPAGEAQVEALVGQVKAARAAVERGGEAVFAEFRQRGGRWFRGDSYIVVLGSDGRSVVYPPDPRGEGLNYVNFQDLGGKPFGRQILAVADSSSGRGWVHYQWRRPNPGDRRPVWKATYAERVTAPSGRTYLVLSGLYEPPMTRAFVEDAVNNAAELLQRQGRAAFETLRDPLGPSYYQDTYVFVLDRNGTLLLNPAFPELEGRNLLQWPDPAERATAAASLKAVLEQGSTWTTYRWPRPSASQLPESKTTYLRKVVLPGGEVLIVGSGMYAGG
jgi:signal transduction histidine kinase